MGGWTGKRGVGLCECLGGGSQGTFQVTDPENLVTCGDTRRGAPMDAERARVSAHQAAAEALPSGAGHGVSWAEAWWARRLGACVGVGCVGCVWAYGRVPRWRWVMRGVRRASSLHHPPRRTFRGAASPVGGRNGDRQGIDGIGRKTALRASQSHEDGLSRG